MNYEEHHRQGYLEIERRAFERYLLELVRGFAAEEERVHREMEGEEFNVLVRGVELVREYPRTALRFELFERSRGIERQSEYPIWDQDYMKANGQMKPGPYIAGEILRMVRGG